MVLSTVCKYLWRLPWYLRQISKEEILAGKVVPTAKLRYQEFRPPYSPGLYGEFFPSLNQHKRPKAGGARHTEDDEPTAVPLSE